MENLSNISYIDVLILLPILIGLIRGLMKGLVVEVVSILAVILGVIAARIWGGGFAGWIDRYVDWPGAVITVVAYALLFLAVALACNSLAALFSKLLKAIHLGWLNRLAGGLFGAAKWGIVVLVIVYGISLLDEQYHFIKEETKKESVCYTKAVQWSNDMLSFTRKQLGQ